jgi:hypothetical protein
LNAACSCHAIADKLLIWRWNSNRCLNHSVTRTRKSTRRYQQVIITVPLDMDGDVRFKAFFAESLIQSKNTISGLTCLVKFLGTISQDFVKQHSFLQLSSI